MEKAREDKIQECREMLLNNHVMGFAREISKLGPEAAAIVALNMLPWFASKKLIEGEADRILAILDLALEK